MIVVAVGRGCELYSPWVPGRARRRGTMGCMVGDRPSVGTVRRGWFPSKHTTCKRQLPDTRPHQAIVTVPSSLLHLAAESMFPTSADCRRVVVPRYVWLVIVVPLSLSLSLVLSSSFSPYSFSISARPHPSIRLCFSPIDAYFLERLYGRTRSRRTFLVFGQNRELALFVSLVRYGIFFYGTYSFHARAWLFLSRFCSPLFPARPFPRFWYSRFADRGTCWAQVWHNSRS